MIKIREYKLAKSMGEAYEILKSNRRNVILGGSCFFNLQYKNVNTAIDLEGLELDYIEEHDREIHIGSETTLYEIERSEIIQGYCDGILSKAVGTVVGVQLRNTAKIGGTVYCKFGFSDIITPLLALDAKVVFHGMGEIKLSEYLKMERPKDIIEKIILPKKEAKGYFAVRRRTRTDFPQLNCAIVEEDKKHRVIVGARPLGGKLIESLGRYLDEYEGGRIELSEGIKNELGLGSNMKASKRLREALLVDILMEYTSLAGEEDDR